MLEALIIPHNYLIYFKTTNIIPVAWSLGLEFHFYILLPLIFYLSIRVKITIVVILFLLQAFIFSINGNLGEYAGFNNFCNDSSINNTYLCSANITQIFGYHLMPVPFMYFLLGNILWDNSKAFLKIIGVYTFFSILILIYYADSGAYSNYLVDDIYLGSIIFIPVAYILLAYSLKTNKIDRKMGNLAYPLFLVHYPVILLVRDIIQVELLFTTSFILMLIFAGMLSYFQEKVDKLRYNFRGFQKEF